jgi:hypothetical protein
MDRWDSAL